MSPRRSKIKQSTAIAIDNGSFSDNRYARSWVFQLVYLIHCIHLIPSCAFHIVYAMYSCLVKWQWWMRWRLPWKIRLSSFQCNGKWQLLVTVAAFNVSIIRFLYLFQSIWKCIVAPLPPHHCFYPLNSSNQVDWTELIVGKTVGQNCFEISFATNKSYCQKLIRAKREKKSTHKMFDSFGRVTYTYDVLACLWSWWRCFRTQFGFMPSNCTLHITSR